MKWSIVIFSVVLGLILGNVQIQAISLKNQASAGIGVAVPAQAPSAPVALAAVEEVAAPPAPAPAPMAAPVVNAVDRAIATTEVSNKYNVICFLS